MRYTAMYDSPIGHLCLYSDGSMLTGLEFTDAVYQSQDLPVFQKTIGWLDSYFGGEPSAKYDIPICLEGTAFRQMVWQYLLDIPYGTTVTYGQIAKALEGKLGRKMSAQAVGQAVGANPVAILIPCHCVVGAKGQLTGYAWGVDKKQWLLRHEMRKEMQI